MPLNALAFGGVNQAGAIDVATACRAKGGSGHGDFESETFVAEPVPHTLRGDERGPAPVLAFTAKDYGQDVLANVSPTLRAGGHDKSHANAGVMPAVLFNWRVRRLTPRECERLQGFPDDYTLVEYRRKPAADGPRYKALGNSMAVNCMRWIGRRIEAAVQLFEPAKPRPVAVRAKATRRRR